VRVAHWDISWCSYSCMREMRGSDAYLQERREV